MKKLTLLAALRLAGCASPSDSQRTTPKVVANEATCLGEPWNNGAAATSEGWQVIEVIGREKDALVANYNNLDPPTDFRPDRVFFALHPNSRVIVVALVSGNCVLDYGRFSVNAFRHLLASPGTAT